MTASRRLPAGGPANWLLDLALVAALVVAWLLVRDLPPLHDHPAVPWWLLAPGFYLAELAVVHLQFRRNAFTFSLSEIPLVIGLFASRPGDVVLAQLLAVVVVSRYNRHQPLVKLVFNSAKYPLEAAIAIALFNVVHPADALSFRGALTACVAVGVASTFGSLLTGLAIGLSEGELPENLPRTMRFAAVASVTNASLAIVGFGFVTAHTTAGWLLLLPAASVVVGYRAYMTQLRERERITRLYEAGQALQSAGGTEAAIAAVLRHARVMFRATFAEIQLIAGSGEVLLASLGLGSEVPAFSHIQANDPSSVTDQLSRPARLVNSSLGRGEIDRRLRQRGLRSVMLAPLGREGAHGVLLVGNPERPVAHFEPAALTFFEAFAAQAGLTFEKDRLQEQFRHLAFHDALTNLANRALFADRANLAMRRARRHGATPAVLLLDLDDFKTVNDSLGHSAGDQLLLAVADRLRACIRPHDTGARLGGDEFAILIEDAHSPGEATGVAERIAAAMARPFTVEGQELTARASIGIALADAQSTAEDLMRCADLAMYHAKSEGKARWVLFEPSMRDAVVERLLLKGDLERESLETQLLVEFQPIVNVQSGAIEGAEALVRWNHPLRGILNPGAFVHLAEETGLVVQLGRFVLAEACRQAQTWPAGSLLVTVNLSARQVQEPDFADDVLKVVRDSGLDPARLVLEITESSVMENPELVSAQCARLTEAGIKMALDDFGTGFSSLNLLQSLGFDVIKISKDFTDRLVGGQGREAFSAAILKLGSTLGMLTIAEGVETAEQAQALRELGCDFAQGYHYHRPLAADAMRRLLDPAAPQPTVTTASA